MSTTTLAIRRSHAAWRSALSRSRGFLVALAVLVILFLIVGVITPGAFSYFELSFMSAGGATLALAAMGQTFVTLTGGFDLSTGAVVSLVNVVLATSIGPDIGSQIAMGVAALAIGGLVGAFNGFFVAFARLQPIVVTLSSMFIVQGITLLVLEKPGEMLLFDLKTQKTKYAVYLRGFKTDPIQGISLSNCDFEGVAQGSVVENVTGINLENVRVNGAKVDHLG